MKTFRLDFCLEAWVNNLEIEAENEKEAIEKLKNMTLSEIAENGSEKQTDIKDNIDCEVVEAEYEIEVYNLVVEDMNGFRKEREAQFVKVRWYEGDDLEEKIEWNLDLEEGDEVISFDYNIINED